MHYKGLILNNKIYMFSDSKIFFKNNDLLPLHQFWLMCDRNFISLKNSHHIKIIQNVIHQYKKYDDIFYDVTGKFLEFDTSLSMFDCLACDETNGFFDENDCPPPEFWIAVVGDRIISYIPEDFILTANKGVEISMSESLVWLEGII